MKWGMDCGIFFEFLLDTMMRIWENSSKISGSDTFFIIQISAVLRGVEK